MLTRLDDPTTTPKLLIAAAALSASSGRTPRSVSTPLSHRNACSPCSRPSTILVYELPTTCPALLMSLGKLLPPPRCPSGVRVKPSATNPCHGGSSSSCTDPIHLPASLMPDAQDDSYGATSGVRSMIWPSRHNAARGL